MISSKNHRLLQPFSNKPPTKAVGQAKHVRVASRSPYSWLVDSAIALPATRSTREPKPSKKTHAEHNICSLIQFIITDNPHINKSTLRLSKHGHAAPGVSVITVGIPRVSPGPGPCPDHKHPMCLVLLPAPLPYPAYAVLGPCRSIL